MVVMRANPYCIFCPGCAMREMRCSRRLRVGSGSKRAPSRLPIAIARVTFRLNPDIFAIFLRTFRFVSSSSSPPHTLPPAQLIDTAKAAMMAKTKQKTRTREAETAMKTAITQKQSLEAVQTLIHGSVRTCRLHIESSC